MPSVRRVTLFCVAALVVLVGALTLSVAPVFADPDDPQAHVDGLVEPTAEPASPYRPVVPEPDPDLPWHLRQIGLPCDPPYHDLAALEQTAVVAVVDTGVDASHPLFRDRLVPGYDFVNLDDGPADDQGHGTGVTSVIAMLAPSISIMPLKALSSSGAGAHSWIANAIVWATDHGADVINLSLGGPYSSSMLEQAVGYAWSHGVVVTAAAGNEAYSNPTYPAAYENAMGVSGLDEDSERSSFSNYGFYVAVSAPSTWIPVGTRGGGYQTWSGTALAAPQAAGLAGLIRAYYPSLEAAQVREAIETGAIDLGAPGWDALYGHGRIHVCRSLKIAARMAGE